MKRRAVKKAQGIEVPRGIDICPAALYTELYTRESAMHPLIGGAEQAAGGVTQNDGQIREVAYVYH